MENNNTGQSQDLKKAVGTVSPNTKHYHAVTLAGSLAGRKVHFFPEDDGEINHEPVQKENDGQGVLNPVNAEEKSKLNAVHSEEKTKLYSTAYNEGKTKAEKDFEKILRENGISKDELPVLAQLKANQAELEKQNLIKKGDYEALIEREKKSFQEQVRVKDELIKQKEEILSQREKIIHDLTIESEIGAQAHKHNAYDVQDVSNALKSLYDIKYDFETKTKQVVIKTGERAISEKTGNPLTIEEAVLKLREVKPHLFKGNGFSGAGTLPNTVQKKTYSQKDIENMSAEELKKYWDEI